MAGLLEGMIPGVISAGVGLWQQSREQNWAANQAELNRQFQAEQAAQANEWNKENWLMQQEYNSPSEMLMRYRAAGISDAQALNMMGNGSTTAGAVQGAPMASGSQAVAPGSAVGAVSSGIGNSMLNAANVMKTVQEAKGQEIENKYKPFKEEAAVKQLYASIDKMKAEERLTNDEADKLEKVLPYVEDMTKIELDTMEQTLSNLQVTFENLILEGVEKEQNIVYLDAKTLTELHNQRLIDAKTYESITAGALNEERIATEESTQAKNYAEAAESRSRIPVNIETANKLREEIIGLKFDNAWKEAGFNPNAKGVAGVVNYLQSTGIKNPMFGVLSDIINTSYLADAYNGVKNIIFGKHSRNSLRNYSLQLQNPHTAINGRQAGGYYKYGTY